MSAIVNRCVRELERNHVDEQVMKLHDDLEDALANMTPENRARIEDLQQKLILGMADISLKRRGRMANFGRDSALELIWALAKWGVGRVNNGPHSHPDLKSECSQGPLRSAHADLGENSR